MKYLLTTLYCILIYSKYLISQWRNQGAGGIPHPPPEMQRQKNQKVLPLLKLGKF